MGKIATSIDEQLELLEKRGMTLESKEKAKEYLLDIGYYRLGFYWHYFEKTKTIIFYQAPKWKQYESCIIWTLT